jgi:hypothetical protein
MATSRGGALSLEELASADLFGLDDGLVPSPPARAAPVATAGATTTLGARGRSASASGSSSLSAKPARASSAAPARPAGKAAPAVPAVYVRAADGLVRRVVAAAAPPPAPAPAPLPHAPGGLRRATTTTITTRKAPVIIKESKALVEAAQAAVAAASRDALEASFAANVPPPPPAPLTGTGAGASSSSSSSFSRPYRSPPSARLAAVEGRIDRELADFEALEALIATARVRLESASPGLRDREGGGAGAGAGVAATVSSTRPRNAGAPSSTFAPARGLDSPGDAYEDGEEEEEGGRGDESDDVDDRAARRGGGRSRSPLQRLLGVDAAGTRVQAGSADAESRSAALAFRSAQRDLYGSSRGHLAATSSGPSAPSAAAAAAVDDRGYDGGDGAPSQLGAAAALPPRPRTRPPGAGAGSSSSSSSSALPRGSRAPADPIIAAFHPSHPPPSEAAAAAGPRSQPQVRPPARTVRVVKPTRGGRVGGHSSGAGAGAGEASDDERGVDAGLESDADVGDSASAVAVQVAAADMIRDLAAAAAAVAAAAAGAGAGAGAPVFAPSSLQSSSGAVNAEAIVAAAAVEAAFQRRGGRGGGGGGGGDVGAGSAAANDVHSAPARRDSSVVPGGRTAARAAARAATASSSAMEGGGVGGAAGGLPRSPSSASSTPLRHSRTRRQRLNAMKRRARGEEPADDDDGEEGEEYAAAAAAASAVAPPRGHAGRGRSVSIWRAAVPTVVPNLAAPPAPPAPAPAAVAVAPVLAAAPQRTEDVAAAARAPGAAPPARAQAAAAEGAASSAEGEEGEPKPRPQPQPTTTLTAAISAADIAAFARRARPRVLAAAAPAPSPVAPANHAAAASAAVASSSASPPKPPRHDTSAAVVHDDLHTAVGRWQLFSHAHGRRSGGPAAAAAAAAAALGGGGDDTSASSAAAAAAGGPSLFVRRTLRRLQESASTAVGVGPAAFDPAFPVAPLPDPDTVPGEERRRAPLPARGLDATILRVYGVVALDEFRREGREWRAREEVRALLDGKDSEAGAGVGGETTETGEGEGEGGGSNNLRALSLLLDHQRQRALAASSAGATLPLTWGWRLLADALGARLPPRRTRLTSPLGLAFQAWRATAGRLRSLKLRFAHFAVARSTSVARVVLLSWFNLALAASHRSRVVARRTLLLLADNAREAREERRRWQVAVEYHGARTKGLVFAAWAQRTRDKADDRALRRAARAHFLRTRVGPAVRRWAGETALLRVRHDLARAADFLHQQHLCARVVQAWRARVAGWKAAAARNRAAVDARRRHLLRAWGGALEEERKARRADAHAALALRRRSFAVLARYAAARRAMQARVAGLVVWRTARSLRGLLARWREAVAVAAEAEALDVRAAAFLDVRRAQRGVRMWRERARGLALVRVADDRARAGRLGRALSVWRAYAANRAHAREGTARADALRRATVLARVVPAWAAYARSRSLKRARVERADEMRALHTARRGVRGVAAFAARLVALDAAADDAAAALQAARARTVLDAWLRQTVHFRAAALRRRILLRWARVVLAAWRFQAHPVLAAEADKERRARSHYRARVLGAAFARWDAFRQQRHATKQLRIALDAMASRRAAERGVRALLANARLRTERRRAEATAAAFHDDMLRQKAFLALALSARAGKAEREARWARGEDWEDGEGEGGGEGEAAAEEARRRERIASILLVADELEAIREEELRAAERLSAIAAAAAAAAASAAEEEEEEGDGLWGSSPTPHPLSLSRRPPLPPGTVALARANAAALPAPSPSSAAGGEGGGSGGGAFLSATQALPPSRDSSPVPFGVNGGGGGDDDGGDGETAEDGLSLSSLSSSEPDEEEDEEEAGAATAAAADVDDGEALHRRSMSAWSAVFGSAPATGNWLGEGGGAAATAASSAAMSALSPFAQPRVPLSPSSARMPGSARRGESWGAGGVTSSSAVVSASSASPLPAPTDPLPALLAALSAAAGAGGASLTLRDVSALRLSVGAGPSEEEEYVEDADVEDVDDDDSLVGGGGRLSPVAEASLETSSSVHGERGASSTLSDRNPSPLPGTTTGLRQRIGAAPPGWGERGSGAGGGGGGAGAGAVPLALPLPVVARAAAAAPRGAGPATVHRRVPGLLQPGVSSLMRSFAPAEAAGPRGVGQRWEDDEDDEEEDEEDRTWAQQAPLPQGQARALPALSALAEAGRRAGMRERR